MHVVLPRQLGPADAALKRAALDEVLAAARLAPPENARQREAVRRCQAGPRQRQGHRGPRLRLGTVSRRLVADLDDLDAALQGEGHLPRGAYAPPAGADHVLGVSVCEEQVAGL